MPKFVLFLDEVGAEVRNAGTNRRCIHAGAFGSRHNFVPMSIRPLEVAQDSGAAKRAAAGYLVLGAGGAAAGVLMGRGKTVVFEMECADGRVRRGAVSQKKYPGMRRAVERIRRYRPGDTRRQGGRLASYCVLGFALAAAGMGFEGFLLMLLLGFLLEIILDRRRLGQPA